MPGGGGLDPIEYDDAYNSGFGYGARTGARQSANANYLSYYGIGVYPVGAFGQTECQSRCMRQGRTGCAAFCRMYG